MFCNNCGKQLADGVNSCPFCGANLAAAPAPQQPIYQQPQQPVYQQPVYQQPQQPIYQQPQQPAYQPPVYQQPIYENPKPIEGSGRMDALSIVGFIMSFCFSLVGLILSAIALFGHHKKDITLKGKGFAKAGFIISVITTAIYVSLYTFFMVIAMLFGAGV